MVKKSAINLVGVLVILGAGVLGIVFNILFWTFLSVEGPYWLVQARCPDGGNIIMCFR